MKTSHSGDRSLTGADLALALLAALLVFGFTFAPAPQHASGALVKTASWGGDLERLNHSPRSLAYDGLGRAYVADAGSGRVVRIETDGSIDHSWQAGQPTGDWKLPNPADIAIDDANNVYVLDQKAWTVRKHDADGAPLGSWFIAPGWDDALHGIAAEAGSVFVISDDLVRRFTPDGDLVDWWSGFDTVEWYVAPLIRGDGNGNLLVTGSVFGPQNKTAIKSIYRFEPDGDLIEKWSTPARVDTEWVQQGDYDVEEIYDIEGYESIAPLSDGTVWTLTDSNFITRYGPSGQVGAKIGEQGNGIVPYDLATGPGDTLLYSWFGYTGEATATIRELDSSNETTREWTTEDFPKYATGDELEGRFRRADDLAVRSDGAVGGYDPGYTRVQLFDSGGGFLKNLEGPDFPFLEDWFHGVAMVLQDGGGIDLLDKPAQKIYRYGGDGSPGPQLNLDLPGFMQDITRDPEGGFIALTGQGAGSGQISLLDEGGAVTAGFPTSGTLDIGNFSGSRIDAYPGGAILFGGSAAVEKYSRSGQRTAVWNAPEYRCRGYRIDDIAIDAAGNAFALVLRDKLYYVLGFDPALKLLWEEPVESSDRESPVKGFLDVGPDGSVFIDVGKGIEKFDKSGASSQPTEPVCPRPQARQMRIEGISYLRGRRAAIVKVRVYEAGRITVSGRRLVRSSRKLPGSGSYRVKVALKRGFVRRSKPRRLTRVPATVSFQGATRANSRTVSLNLSARHKPGR
ncbi:MAG: hypothetical protein KDB52_07600 [Solirubrobacterales bacterium]|nr:hypothetical protein [Solirubrobacterales bacterium]